VVNSHHKEVLFISGRASGGIRTTHRWNAGYAQFRG
jgi:hypothetical protein